MQAREKNREFTACDKCYREMHESGRMRANQEQGGASNVRATQGDADGRSRHALGEKCRYQGRVRKHRLVTHHKMWLII
jgi:hypothetical protein